MPRLRSRCRTFAGLTQPLVCQFSLYCLLLTLIQARRDSSRLPDKVSLDLAGQPLLVRMVERVQRARLVGKVAVITTTDPADDALASLCEAHNINVFRAMRPTCWTAITAPHSTLAKPRPW